ncbi:hypothetical protein ABZ671_27315 [Micromonospora sp. NPDC006766]|uniref:hypothetical protein n=1 Tax=Micromonospora sp. NPDC006766 TaxID=3154778 RepID=UPI0033FD58F6
MNYGDLCWDFRRLPGQLKLELQYALKRNHELGFPPSSHSYSQTVRMLVRRGATTLLEQRPRLLVCHLPELLERPEPG